MEQNPQHSCRKAHTEKLIKGPVCSSGCLYTNKYQNVYVLLTADAVHKQWQSANRSLLSGVHSSAVRSPNSPWSVDSDVAAIWRASVTCYHPTIYSFILSENIVRVFMKSNIRYPESIGLYIYSPPPTPLAAAHLAHMTEACPKSKSGEIFEKWGKPHHTHALGPKKGKIFMHFQLNRKWKSRSRDPDERAAINTLFLARIGVARPPGSHMSLFFFFLCSFMEEKGLPDELLMMPTG